MEEQVGSSRVMWPAKVFWLITVVALALILLYLPRSPLPWLDEIFYASAALARVRGGPAIPSVMAAFPNISRLDLLYGPLISYLGSLEIRIFGLSATSWRLLGFWGAVGAVFSASWVSRRLDRSPEATAAAAMTVALSQGMGARATSGRFDTVTMMLELLSLACTLGAMRSQRSRRSAFFLAVLAGGFCALAALSTPRAFPFVLGLLVAVGLEIALARKWEFVARGLILGLSALLPVWVWTFSQGMTPIGWLRFIAAASRGDKINVSPIMHGAWHVFDGPLVPLLSGLLVILVMLLVFGGAVLKSGPGLETEGDDFRSGVRLASITVLINYFALFVMISRFWDYEIFVVPLVVPVLTALTAKLLRNRGRRTLQRAILASWLLLAIFLVTVRSGKVAAWFGSYHARDPQPLQDFVRDKVPGDSWVFGPDDFYFYAVEATGSHYLFSKLIIPAALTDNVNREVDWQEQLKARSPAYLIWPSGTKLPLGLGPANLHLEGTFSPHPDKDIGGRHREGWDSGYPPTSLYRIVDAPRAN